MKVKFDIGLVTCLFSYKSNAKNSKLEVVTPPVLVCRILERYSVLKQPVRCQPYTRISPMENEILLLEIEVRRYYCSTNRL